MDNTALDQIADTTRSFSQQTLFSRALQAIESGKRDVAEYGFAKMIHSAPNPGEGYYQVGMLLLQHNHPAYAKDYLGKACRLIPNVCDNFFQLGRCSQQLGELDEAIANYQNALAIDSKHPEALAHLSLCYYKKNEFELAERSTVNWIHAYPALAPAYNLLGCIYLHQHRYRDAISQFNQALQFDVAYYEAIVNLGQAHTHLYHYQEAEAYLHRALAINNTSTQLQTYCGINALNQRKFTAAHHHFEQALKLDNSNALAYANLSVLLQHRCRFGSSNKAMRRALLLDNRQADFYAQFAGNLLMQNHPHKAIKSCRRALQLMPQHVKSRTMLGEALLSISHYQEGWKQRYHQQPQHDYAPSWDGKPFPGKVLLVYWDVDGEEAILLLRYLQCLPKYGRRITVMCPVQLAPLLEKNAMLEHVWLIGTDVSKLISIDLQVYASALPQLLQTTIETIPQHFPYITVQKNSLRTWRDILKRYPHQQRKIGISWEPPTSSSFTQDVPFAAFAAIAKQLPKTSLFNLTPYQNHKQYEYGDQLGLHDVGTRDVTVLCAIIQQLDLIITCDNLVAHLAGALGKAVCLLAPFAVKWYWLADDDIPLWYPTVRLFRQSLPNQWKDVIINLLKYIRQSKLCYEK